MTTLVTRLAGPLQSWAVDTQFLVVGSHPTPTLSALLGICRAALGHGHDDDPGGIAWLRNLTIAVRVDRPGGRLLDYHTINPLPYEHLRFHGLTEARLAQVPRGDAQPWQIKRRPQTMETRRLYYHDAAYLWLTTGPDELLDRLTTAFAHPVWQRYAGRKACTLAAPFLLGRHPTDLPATAAAVPVITGTAGHPTVTRDLVFVTAHAPATGPHTTVQHVPDNPTGTHPQHGYTRNRHLHMDTTAPVVHDLVGLLGWARENLR